MNLKGLNVIINKPRPKVHIRESPNNIGLVLERNKSKLSESEIKTIISGFGISNARIMIEEPVSIDELIGLVSGKYQYMKAIVALNKIDNKPDYEKTAKALSEKYSIQVVPISATEKANIDKTEGSNIQKS